ncbi:monovalent cation/H(+) antiporter subunit G [Salegentibacter sp. Hel_I_6]|uniref:monovalent cation/H(+) antiporter subunit G n=1 Tax=Salegentibacter sp. Hel_I_6 TaxID=1250278 RepID=UPI00056943B2|nr:monovalent cation/H(+) antiporter subunit G [Salegentibacter sp. Hel_I_6]
MSSIIIVILVTLGTLFVLLSAIGLVRMPDTYMRISVNTKAATLGVGLILVGTAVFFNDLSTTSRSLVIILFVFLTAPVSAHLIGRASYFMGVKMWKNSVLDDLEGKYQKGTHVLKSDLADNSSEKNKKQDSDDLVK